MALRRARAFRHPETGILSFRRAVRVAGRGRVGKREISQSLATRDPDTAKERAAPRDAAWNARLKSLPSGVTVLTRKHIVAREGGVFPAPHGGPVSPWRRSRDVWGVPSCPKRVARAPHPGTRHAVRRSRDLTTSASVPSRIAVHHIITRGATRPARGTVHGLMHPSRPPPAPPPHATRRNMKLRPSGLLARAMRTKEASVACTCGSIRRP